MRFSIAVALFAAAWLAAGCSSHASPEARAPLTERQRDSVLAKTNLPGASVVGRALDVSDRAAARAAGMNAAVDSLPR